MTIIRTAFCRQSRIAWAIVAGAVLDAAASTMAAAPVTDLQAVHREGQTFLTWKESDSPAQAENLSFPKYRAMVQAQREKGPKVHYRIYRSDKPIVSVEGLRPVGETGPLSCWNGSYFGSGDPKETDLVPRYVIADGQPPLAPGTGLYVHNPQIGGHGGPPPQGEGGAETWGRASAPAHSADSDRHATGPGYYAVTVVTDGKEDATLTGGNVLKAPVEEKLAQGVPVLQDSKEVKAFNFVSGPTLRHYVRWEAPPHANRENQPNDILVAIPKDLAKPAPVGLHLHCWGGSPWGGYGWWYNAEKGAILIAANQVPYDWWTGYHELYGKGPRDQKAWSNGVVHPYTQKRVLSLVDWAATQWEIDRSRVFTGGISMGGSGAPMLAIRNPDKIAWAIGWVGIHVPQMSSHFKGSYARVYGEPEWGVKFEDGTPVWDYFSDVWYLRQHPARETPFITWSNGKNDGAIGWAQALEFYKAMQETRRPHLFVWGQGGHDQRAVMPLTHDQRIMPIDIRIDQSLPAFTKCSLDGNPGNGDPEDGDKDGAVNYWLYWETKDIVDDAGAWEMTVALMDKASKDECTVDLTPRRLQTFKLKAGEALKWTSTSGGKETQSGALTVDPHGLATIEGLKVGKAGNRIRIAR
jgi:hypothetical protein